MVVMVMHLVIANLTFKGIHYARMLERKGLVGLDEHPPPTFWKSSVRKSTENKHSFWGHMEASHVRSAG